MVKHIDNYTKEYFVYNKSSLFQGNNTNNTIAICGSLLVGLKMSYRVFFF